MFFTLKANTGYAQWAVIDASQIAQTAKMISDNYQRYMMLVKIFKNAKAETDLIRAINQGIENTTGLLHSLPIKDEGFLAGLDSFNESYSKISEIYGAIPKSPEMLMQRLHDNTIAESLKMLTFSKKYAKAQESNAETISVQSRSASPKGAARMAAESNAQILHGISQLIRLQGQSLKMQSEEFALKNNREKLSSGNHNKINAQFAKAFKTIKVGGNLPRF